MTPLLPPIAQLAALASTMAEEDFARFFPGLFLLTEHLGDAVRDRTFATSLVPGYRVRPEREVLAVTPLVKREGVNPYGAMITIGRARNNDIVIDEPSVSKLHGWLRRHEEKSGEVRYTLTDAGSRNGTYLDGVPLAGEPSRVSVGSRLRLGLVELRIADAPALHRALRVCSRTISRAA